MQTKIKIIESNRVKIEAVISEAQSKARVRMIDVDDVFNAVSEVRERLNIPKCKLSGVRAWVDRYARVFPGRYHGIPEGTQFCFTFNAKGEAVLVEVGRWQVTQRDTGRISIIHTEESKAALVERFSGWG